MLPEHKNAFFLIAAHFNCWIGLREPNELADKWIGKPDYIPKSKKCKAKTADNPNFNFSGLVVNPLLCPNAFIEKSRPDATKKWKSFIMGYEMPFGYTCSESGPEKGLVKFAGKAIHADFDLMTLSKAGNNGEFVFTSTHEENSLFRVVRPMLNHYLGSEMIQHGSEFMWKDGVGGRESERVFYFGPKRQFKIAHSSMPTDKETMH
ncbi:hypothetical protein ABID22_000882 [Pontibacter aydingkolensis]|uniref:Uncharacterized protein n=1 Tax=Pontibacter aydingkolensis TaxID=1911536 RepID=A0ABS7CSQ0_9BACT|nr:hypothetical protein [Pontibacter aydingkolensis]MBW7466866.1 hypothetical protein [Pontibacter aydingkolensis]